MAICRHALPLAIVAWMLQVSQPTLTRIFEAWVTFGDAVFSSLDLQPSHDLITSRMPTQFKSLGFGHVALILDATEFRVGRFSDLNLNTLFFSDYKQCHTVKALVCLSPHGALCQVPDLYPGSITDTDITTISGALNKCQVLDGVLTDKGFAISELAAEKGAEHNRPPMKSASQFTEGQCDENFNIACLRIHVERWYFLLNLLYLLLKYTR
uniref:uncharacterized protein LOC120330294 n=1 Tax=Styela clava TaxID=7725 RepID=UPI0019392E5C|nr:uncharacterized protein LOC120330294 [Styela clava]